jgi:hypothetical protein
MASVIVRLHRKAELDLKEEDIADTRPAYLCVFPSASLILKDLKLGVLLGRYKVDGS